MIMILRMFLMCLAVYVGSESSATAASALPAKVVITPANDLTETLRQLKRMELSGRYPEAAAKTKSLRAN